MAIVVFADSKKVRDQDTVSDTCLFQINLNCLGERETSISLIILKMQKG